MSKKSKKVDKKEELFRKFNIKVPSHEEKCILRAAISILDENGLTICRKDDLVLENEMFSQQIFELKNRPAKG